jgi:hypothetical protein
MRTVSITALGRGRYGRTLVTDAGFPRGYLMQHKRVQGFQTGDLVQAEMPEMYRNKPLKTHGIHRGRVAVRERGAFCIGKTDSINAKYCRLVQRADGYELGLLSEPESPPSRPERNASFLPMTFSHGEERGVGLMVQSAAGE